MKLTLADLRAQCPDIPEPVLNEYLARLDENYFAVFSLPQMRAHLYALERLRPEHPVEVIFELGLEGQTACTVLAFDYPAEFSLITGVLSAMGFDILSGDVFTSARAKAEASRRRRSNRIKTIYIDPGNPWQNGFAESFHGRFRDECLNREQLWTLTEARVVIEDLRCEYNHYRPHSKLGYLSPSRFAAQRAPSPTTVGLRPPFVGNGQIRTHDLLSTTDSD